VARQCMPRAGWRSPSGGPGRAHTWSKGRAWEAVVGGELGQSWAMRAAGECELEQGELRWISADETGQL
jgi:hypothetical protein